MHRGSFTREGLSTRPQDFGASEGKTATRRKKCRRRMAAVHRLLAGIVQLYPPSGFLSEVVSAFGEPQGVAHQGESRFGLGSDLVPRQGTGRLYGAAIAHPSS